MNWPATLPQDMFWDVNIQRQDTRLRTEMDAGPVKQRKKFTASVVFYSLRTNMTGTQRDTLESFYQNDLSEGSLAFNFKDPTSDATTAFRFVEPPGFRMLVGAGEPGDRIYSVSMQVERMP